MTLPTSGPISASMINAELGRDSNARFHINGADERALAEVPTGLVTFADFYGKSRGSFTPQADYPDPIQIDTDEAYPGASVNIVASISFNLDGTITLQGTPTDTIPARWYVNGPAPPDTRILIVLLGSTQTGEASEINSTVVNNPNWQSISSNPSAVVKVNSSVAPVIPSGIAASYGIFIALNGQVMVEWATSLSADFTITP